MKTNTSILVTIVFVLAYVLPYQNEPYLNYYHEWLAFLSLIALLAYFPELRTTSISLPSLVLIPFTLLVLLIIHVLSDRMTYYQDSVLPAGYLIGLICALILGASITKQYQEKVVIFPMLSWAFLAAGLLSSGIATLQITGQEALIRPLAMPMRHTGTIRPYANLGQPNQLALVFCLGIASVWYLNQKAQLKPTVAVLCLVVLIWGEALTQSRIGWLILPLFAAFSLLMKNAPRIKPITQSLPVILLAVYGCLITALPHIDFGVTEDGQARALPAMAYVGTTSERLILFRQALQISLEQPWLGAGWFEFGPRQILIGADFAPSVYSHHAHNLILNLAAEIGWPSTLAIIGGLVYWYYRACWRPVQTRTVSPETGFAAFFLSAVFIHSMVEYPLWYAYILLPVALIMGAVHQIHFGARTVAIPRYSLLIVFMLSLGSLLTVAQDYRKLVTGFRALGWESMDLPPEEGSTEKPDWTLFPQFYDYFRFTKIKAAENMTTEEIAFMEQVAKRFGNAMNMMRLSLVYALNHREQDAVRTLETLYSLHPSQYSNAYRDWKALAAFDPEQYAGIFEHMPPLPVKASDVIAAIVE